MERRESTFGGTVKKGFLLLIFEFFGSACLIIFQRMLTGVGLFLGYWLLLAMSEKISGAHYNPAVTIACMFRKNVGKFSRWLGVAYMVCQCVGMLSGALLAFMWTTSGGFLTIREDKFVFQAMVIEAAGSFFFITIFLINTEVNTKFFQEPGFRLLAIAAAYTVAVETTRGLAGGSINPAFGLCVNITMFMDSGDGEALKWIWLYIFLPFAGSALAVVFHEFVYKKTHESIEELEQSGVSSNTEPYIPPTDASVSQE